MNPDGDGQLRATYQRSRTTIPARMDGQTVASIGGKKLKSCPLDMTINKVKAKSHHSPTRTPYSLAKVAKNCIPKRGQIKLVSSLTKQLPKKRESNKCKKNNAEGSNVEKVILQSAPEPEAIRKKLLSTEIGHLHSDEAATTLADTNSIQFACLTDLSHVEEQETKLPKMHNGHPTTPEEMTLKQEPILSKPSSSELCEARNDEPTDVSSRGSTVEVNVNSKGQFILPVQAKPAKKSKEGSNLLTQEISALKGENSVIVEEDAEVLNCPQRESVTSMDKVIIGSDLAEEIEFRSLEEDDSSALSFGKEEMDTNNYDVDAPRQQSANEILEHPEPFQPEECEPDVEEPEIMIKTPNDSPTKHENVISTSKWSSNSTADLEYETDTPLKLDELQRESRRLLEKVEACRCDMRPEHDYIRDTDDAQEITETGGELKGQKQTLKVEEEQLTSKARLDVECTENAVRAAAEHKLVETTRPSQETLSNVHKFKSRCAALEDRIADMTRRDKEVVDAREERVKLLQEDLDAMKKKLMEETSLREECEKNLEEHAEFVKRSDAEMGLLFKLNDPRKRHPYPRPDAVPSEFEKESWNQEMAVRKELIKERAEEARVRAERDKLLKLLYKLLESKDIDPNDPDVHLVVMNKAAVEALEGDVKRLTRDVEEKKAGEDRWKKEAMCLEATLNAIEGGADATSVLSENYLLEKQVRALVLSVKNLHMRFENSKDQLYTKLFQCEQRERAMSEHLAAHSAYQRLVELMAARREAVAATVARGRGQRQRGTEDGDRDCEARCNGSPTSVMSLPSAVVSGPVSPPSSPPSETGPST